MFYIKLSISLAILAKMFLPLYYLILYYTFVIFKIILSTFYYYLVYFLHLVTSINNYLLGITSLLTISLVYKLFT